MTDLGYKPVFDKAVQQAASTANYTDLFPDFRNQFDFFHFTMAHYYKRYSSDTVSLEAAKNINPIFYTSLINKGPSKAGNPNTSVVDYVESNHILMMTYLATKIGLDWGNVVEIGGGYGNCLRLVSGDISFSSWNIVDLQHVSELQKWFLEAEKIDISKVEFNQPILNPTVVLGTHSLSEFSLSDFEHYMNLVQDSKWLFYACHNSKPSLELLQKKQEIIKSIFTLDDSLMYEDGACTMYIFRK